MIRPKSHATTILLAAMVAIGPLATDIYLPALPTIAKALDAGTDEAQLTLSVFLLGFAISQLVYGPLADRFGRKPLIVSGLAVFVVASIGCAFATSIYIMIAMRFLQALGGCVGPVLGRAAVRDIHGPRDAGRVLSYMASAMALAPGIAPIIGGYLLGLFDWPSVFVFVALYGVIVTALVAWILPEPLPVEYHQPIEVRLILRNYLALLRNRSFVGYTLACSCVYSGLFAFVSGSSFVLIRFLGVSEQNYGFYFMLIVLGYIAGNLFAARISYIWDVPRLTLVGSIVAATGGLIMALLSATHVYTVAAIVVPHMLFMAGVGIVMPQSMAGALGPFPRMAGSASALLGFIQMTLAAGAGALVGALDDGTSHAMTFVIAAAGILTLSSFLFIARTAPELARPMGESLDR